MRSGDSGGSSDEGRLDGRARRGALTMEATTAAAVMRASNIVHHKEDGLATRSVALWLPNPPSS